MIIGNSKVPKQKTQWFFYIHQKKKLQLEIKKHSINYNTPKYEMFKYKTMCVYRYVYIDTYIRSTWWKQNDERKRTEIISWSPYTQICQHVNYSQLDVQSQHNTTVHTTANYVWGY